MPADDEEDYFVPLVDQRVFGAGIKRKRVAFVPAAEIGPSSSGIKSSTVGSTYLSIVLGRANNDSNESTAAVKDAGQDGATRKCSVCGQALVGGDATEAMQSIHDSSIAHQICLAHSHPPSHLDRDHVGLRYMQGHGWDPDARAGLGARQEGIRVPIKARGKKDTAGLGLISEGHEEIASGSKTTKPLVVKERGKSLNAREARHMEVTKSRKADRLRQLIYGEDLSSYLGPSA